MCELFSGKNNCFLTVQKCASLAGRTIPKNKDLKVGCWPCFIMVHVAQLFISKAVPPVQVEGISIRVFTTEKMFQPFSLFSFLSENQRKCGWRVWKSNLSERFSACTIFQPSSLYVDYTRRLSFQSRRLKMQGLRQEIQSAELVRQRFGLKTAASWTELKRLKTKPFSHFSAGFQWLADRGWRVETFSQSKNSV